VKKRDVDAHMIDQNWLLSYQTIEGINNILTQMDGRTKNKSKMRFATEELRSYTLNLRRTLQISFDDLRAHAKQN
jgi:acyl carrier protein phosphodiesterase